MWFLSTERNTQEPKNYRSIFSYLFQAIKFRRVLYEIIFKFFTENSLMSKYQSSYKLGDSCTNPVN